MKSIFKHNNICAKPVEFLPALLFLLMFTSCLHQPDPIQQSRQHHAQAEENIYLEEADNEEITDSEEFTELADARFELPIIKADEAIVKHFAYTLSYNENYEQPNWVAYKLKAEYLNGTAKRQNDFRPDPAVTTLSAEPQDYWQSGYDRGHLVPAGDMKWSKKAMSESFLMSNICPQLHNFNSGIWEKLEADVRKWVKRDSELYIITGPVFTTEPQRIGKNKVAVPNYFFKAILDIKPPQTKAIAFIIPHENTNAPYWNYAVSVDSLEQVLKLDLFTALPDNIEAEIERTHIWHLWKLPKSERIRSR